MKQIKREEYIQLVNNVVHKAMGLTGLEIVQHTEERIMEMTGLPVVSARVVINIDHDVLIQATVDEKLDNDFYVDKILKAFGNMFQKGTIVSSKIECINRTHQTELDGFKDRIEELETELGTSNTELIGARAVIVHMEKSPLEIIGEEYTGTIKIPHGSKETLKKWRQEAIKTEKLPETIAAATILINNLEEGTAVRDILKDSVFGNQYIDEAINTLQNIVMLLEEK